MAVFYMQSSCSNWDLSVGIQGIRISIERHKHQLLD